VPAFFCQDDHVIHVAHESGMGDGRGWGTYFKL
jgi:hypothetical protein